MIQALLPIIGNLVGDVIDKTVPNKNARAKAKEEIEKSLLEASNAGALAQIEVNKEQAKSPSIFVAGARPAIMWICALGLCWQFFLGPILGWASSIWWPGTPMPVLEVEGLMTLTMSLLGLGAMRSYEKSKKIHRDNIK